MSQDATINSPTGLQGRSRSTLSPLTRDPWSEWLRPAVVQSLVMVVAAFLIRSVEFGDPITHFDEQFYLLAGDRFLHGALPYVDVWDRKPIGLFLIYAAIRLLGGVGVIQYQVVASLFAAATAVMIARIAMRMASPVGAVMAGIAYLLWIGSLGGDGGQSPVFYNLFTITVAMLTLRFLDRHKTGRFAWSGALVMLICGMALQIKYTVLFEGMFFGLVLLWGALHGGAKPVRIVGLAVLWVGCALLPTVAALMTYVSLGQGQAFWFANFQSVFGRASPPASLLVHRLANIAMKLSPLLVGSVLSFWPSRRARAAWSTGEMWTRRFVLGWLFSAIFGLLIFGTYFDHYALPLLLPLTIACAPALGRLWSATLAGPRLIRLCAAAAVLVAGGLFTVHLVHKYREARRDESAVASLVEAIVPKLKTCMFMFEGDPILYLLTHACAESRFVFPAHLNDRIEGAAIGVDQSSEVQRILSKKPSIIVVYSHAKPIGVSNQDTAAIVQSELDQHYHTLVSAGTGNTHSVAYERNADTVP